MNTKLFKNRNFSLFIFGQTTSTLGTNLLHFATAFYILELTGSAGKYASIITLGMIPNLIIGPIAGTITDRVNRKKMIIFADTIRCILDLLLFSFSLFNNISIEIMYLYIIFFSICEVFFQPAFTTILPSIVSKDSLVDAIALKRTIGRTISVASPLIGALLLKRYGFTIILIIDGLTFGLSALSEVFIRIPSTGNLYKKKPFLYDVFKGFKVLFINKKVSILICNNIITNLFFIPFVFLGFPYIIIEILGGNQIDYGSIQSVATAGSLLSIVAVGIARKNYDTNKCISIGIIFATFPFVLILMLINNDIIYLFRHNSLLIIIYFGLIIFIFRLLNTLYDVFYSSLYQTIIPTHILGRYVAFQSVLITVSRIIGLKMFGILFDSYNLVIPITILGLGILLKILIYITFISYKKYM